MTEVLRIMIHIRHTGDVPGTYYLRDDFDRRLLAYASRSWNAYQAVHALQQFSSLLPEYTANLRLTFGPGGIGEPRRAWGVLADLVSAMTGSAPTIETLVDFGFRGASTIGHVIPYGGDFALASSPIVRHLFWPADAGLGVDTLLQGAARHDRVAKKLLGSFREEVRSYDLEICELSGEGSAANDSKTFFHLFRTLSSVPTEFPLWDGRPMFLDEQRGFLDYLAKFIGAEIVADALIDEKLGEYLLRNSGYVAISLTTGQISYRIERIPAEYIELPVNELAFRVGSTALGALNAFDPAASALERFYAVENAVSEALHLDISPTFSQARDQLVADELSYFLAKEAESSATPFEFPDFNA